MRRVWLPLSILAVLVVIVALAVSRRSAPCGPPMTADQVFGAEAALSPHPTLGDITDLALARCRGMSNGEIRGAATFLRPSGG